MSNSKREKCPHCRQLIDDEATKCPWCHSDLTSWAESNRKRKQGGCLGVIVIIIIVGLIGKCNGDDDSDNSQSSSNTNTKTEQVVENEISYSNDNQENKNISLPTENQTKEITYIEEKIEIKENIDAVELSESTDDSILDVDFDIETFKQLVDDIRKTDFDKAKKDKKNILQTIASFKSSSMGYDEIISFTIENNKELKKKWEKDGLYFNNQIDFYESFVSGNYKKLLQAKKENNNEAR